MKLLIDFLNVQEFSAEILLELHKKHGLFHSIAGQERGYEDKMLSSGFSPETIFFFDREDSLAADFKENAGDLISLPGDEKFQGLFDYLKILQGVWAESLEKTIAEGPDLQLLSDVEEKVKIIFEPGGSFWEVKPRYWLQGACFEDYLDFAYLHIFLTGQGGTMKRLRTCKNPDCGKWFVYNRPKQTFCGDACRHRYNNHIKIKSGYLAAHQRKGREENPNVYNH